MARKSENPAADAAVELIQTECLAVRLRMLNRVINAIYDEGLRPLDVKVGQVNMLVVVSSRGPLGPQGIGRILRMEKSTVSRNIERMTKRGWLRASTGSDDRSMNVEITAKGRALIAEVLPIWRRSQRKAREVLGEDLAQSIQAVGDEMLVEGVLRG